MTWISECTNHGPLQFDILTCCFKDPRAPCPLPEVQAPLSALVPVLGRLLPLMIFLPAAICLGRNNNHLQQDTRKTLYKTFIQFNYAVWYSFSLILAVWSCSWLLATYPQASQPQPQQNALNVGLWWLCDAH